MNLTKLAIRRPVSMFIVVLALVVFGFSAMLGAPLELMPDMEMPAMIILTIYPGAGPEEVNDLVTSVIEDSAASLSGVKNVTSQSKENMSLVMLEMDYGANMDVAHMDLQEKLDMYKSTLPDDAPDPDHHRGQHGHDAEPSSSPPTPRATSTCSVSSTTTSSPSLKSSRAWPPPT